jgi:hypothetical protein
MALKIGLVGPSYQEASLPFDAQRSINLYPVLDQQGKETAALFGVPGLELFATCGQGPGRKCFTSQNGRAFVVSGSSLYEVLADGTATVRGALLQTEGNVTVAENPTQLAVCDGQNLFIFTYSTNTFAKVTDGDLPSAGTVTFMDGYFIVTEVGTGRFYISAFNDGTAWDSLDFATAESDPDNLLIAINAAGQLWLLGVISSEIWSNTGASDFPFRRISGAKLDVGILSPYTALELDNSVFWLGRDRRGLGMVYKASGFTPERISTAPIEHIIQQATDLENCRSYAYQQNGRMFYVLTGGGLPTSLAYDLSTKMWHERAQLNSQGVYEQHIAYDHMIAFDLHLVVDRRNGKVYRMSDDLYSNAGEVRSCERIFTHLSDEDKRRVYSKLVIGVEAGVGLQSGQGSDPQISLRLSKDGARTWSDWYNTSIGAVGQYKNKATFRRLGMAEIMTFNIRITDPVKVAITGAYVS